MKFHRLAGLLLLGLPLVARAGPIESVPAPENVHPLPVTAPPIADLALQPVQLSAAAAIPAPLSQNVPGQDVAPVDPGLLMFDGGLGATPAVDAVPTMREAPETPRLVATPTLTRSSARKIPLAQRATEIAELGALNVGHQIFSGIAALALDFPLFPLTVGLIWGFAGAELIKSLGKLRGVVVGGWQASHDQKMRHDYGTGKLVDIRGHKYGKDRLDVFSRGTVTRRERLVIELTGIASGLPWVLSAGFKGVGLYAVGLAAAYAARAVWRRSHPEPEPVDKAPDFERDR